MTNDGSEVFEWEQSRSLRCQAVTTTPDSSTTSDSQSCATRKVRITEVGPRDGLQNQPARIATEAKIKFIDALSQAGVAEIEVSSFVSPKWVPQLSDAAEVFAGITRHPEVIYSALVPNMTGLERAIESRAGKISLFTAATDDFNLRNTNSTVAQSIERFRPMVDLAQSAALPVRGYISCVVRCPYAGVVDPDAVADVVAALLDLGITEIDLGETLGVAVPTEIERLYDAVSTRIDPTETTFHMHDTRGTGLACVVAAYQLGVRSFDTSAGGLGGCPYAPGAMGNVPSEDVVFCFERMGIPTGVDLDQMVRAGVIIEHAVGKPLPGRAYRARKGQMHI